MMDTYVGIVRTKEDLEKGISEIERLKGEARNVKAHGASQFNPGWDEALSLRALLITSEAVAKAALMREESRGAHTRIDFESEREEWLKVNVVTRKGADGRMEVRKVQRPDAPADLAAIAHAKIEDLEAGKVVIPRREPQAAPSGSLGNEGRSLEECRLMPSRTFQIWRGNAAGGGFQTYQTEVEPGDGGARRSSSHSGPSGQRLGAALELQGRKVRLVQHGDQRAPASFLHDADEQLRSG